MLLSDDDHFFAGSPLSPQVSSSSIVLGLFYSDAFLFQAMRLISRPFPKLKFWETDEDFSFGDGVQTSKSIDLADAVGLRVLKSKKDADFLELMLFCYPKGAPGCCGGSLRTRKVYKFKFGAHSGNTALVLLNKWVIGLSSLISGNTTLVPGT